MASYEIRLERRALKALARLPEPIRTRVSQAIGQLAEDPRPRGCRQLVGSDDLFRIRVGDYRVIYTVRDEVLLVLIVRVAHRRESYR